MWAKKKFLGYSFGGIMLQRNSQTETCWKSSDSGKYKSIKNVYYLPFGKKVLEFCETSQLFWKTIKSYAFS